MGVKGFSVLLLLLAALLLSPSTASALFLYDWSSAQRVADPVGDAGGSDWYGRDITAAYQAYVNGYLYMRIDLRSAPSGAVPPGYADTYGLYIDSRPGGALNDDRYVPGALTGIDFIVSSELEIERHNRLDWDPEFMVWRVDEFSDSDHLRFQATENGGRTLEWRVLDGTGLRHVGSSFTWWAATMLPGGEHSVKTTYDMAGPTVTPIPGAAWLLGSGIIGLIGLKRRANKGK